MITSAIYDFANLIIKFANVIKIANESDII